MLQPIDIGSLHLARPLMNGSGVVDIASTDPEWRFDSASLSDLGAYVTKSITVEPRAGYPAPWVELWDDHSFVNAVGLANPGIEAVELQWDQVHAALDDIPVVVSVAQTGGAETVIQRLSALSWVHGIELNLSCPNVERGLVGADPRASHRAIAAARAQTNLPLLAKLTPACGLAGEVARACVDAGADAIVAGNTMPVLAVRADGSPMLSAGTRAGLSGRALHPIALGLVDEVARTVDVPVVGLGGIDSLEAARRMRDAGASVLGIGTGAMLDPTLIKRLAIALASSTL
jgi:dihydroorotate dehydrogenase (NAD+) catalytic subunit